MTFCLLINQRKALKNVFFTIGIPFILFVCDSYTQFIPSNCKNGVTLLILSYITYSIKNYIENRTDKKDMKTLDKFLGESNGV